MKRHFRFLTADFDFYSLQLSLFAGGINYCWLMLLRSSMNLRAREEEVNYRSLVQSREKSGGDFRDER
jgi:hypothetical protein